MSLKAVYDSMDEIPEQYQELFSERGGRYELTGVQGVKTEEDVRRLQESLRKEREDHRSTKDKFSVWGELDHDDVMGKLDRISELEAAAADKIDDAKLDEIVQARLLREKGPLERDLSKKAKLLEELTEKVTTYETADRRRKIHDALRGAASEAKVRPEAVEDLLLLGERCLEVCEDGAVLTKDGSGFLPGQDPLAFILEIQPKRPHWWPPSEGGGARGGSSSSGGFPNNPFSASNWNVTEQHRAVKEHGLERAEQMAKAAGTTLGGRRPEK